MVEVKGKAGIVAKILADSVNEQGNRLTTFELEYPRMILSELNTHGMLCKNSASSRAIPFEKMQKQLTGRPVRFGQANPGMQDRGEEYESNQLGYYGKNNNGDDEWFKLTPFAAWELAKEDATKHAQRFYNAGYHKQVYNRLTEPFQMMKTVLSATEFDNFFWLRDDDAADPTLHELARCMREAREQSVPQLLKPGQYHLPYVESEIQACKQFFYISEWVNDEHLSVEHLTLEHAIKVSAARCAAASFRNEDYGLEKCLEVYERLVGADRKHASAFQHQASPMEKTSWSLSDVMGDDDWEDGVSHMDRDGNLWSAQYKGWIMFRKLIAGENYSA